MQMITTVAVGVGEAAPEATRVTALMGIIGGIAAVLVVPAELQETIIDVGNTPRETHDSTYDYQKNWSFHDYDGYRLYDLRH